MRVLITGACGFAGRHLARLCARNGASVVGAGRSGIEDARRPEDLDDYVSVDLTDPRRTTEVIGAIEPTWIFHLAAAASVRESWDAPRETLETNIRASLNLLEGIRSVDFGPRVLIACSGDEYGAVGEDDLPITEDQPLRPLSPYAASKAAVDVIAAYYAAAYEMSIVRTRAFNHAGPGQTDKYVLGSFARQIATAELAEATTVDLFTGNLQVRRDFTDVRDVVHGYWLALERGLTGAFNLCSGRSRPLAQLLGILEDLTQVDVRPVTDPHRLRAGEAMDLFGTHGRLTAATGWQPKIPIETTLADALDFWRTQVNRRNRRG